MSGIKYTPRQDKEQGRIGKYEIYVSSDGKEWGTPVAEGTFKPGKMMQEIRFTPCKVRFIRLKVLSALDGGKQAAVAELEVMVDE